MTQVYQAIIQEKKGENCGATRVRISIASVKGLVEEGALEATAMLEIKKGWKEKVNGKECNELMDEGFAKLSFKLKDPKMLQVIFMALEMASGTGEKRRLLSELNLAK